MARTRQVKPDFFLNEELAQLEPMARLLFIGLWLLADREGRLEDRPLKIKAQLFPYEAVDVDALLSELADGFLSRYKAEGGSWIQIPNFKKHQHVHPDEKISVIPKNPEIPGDFKRSPEIMPLASSTSPSTSSSPSSSTSPKQPDNGPIDLGNLGKLAKRPGDMGADFSDYRLPVGFGGSQFSRAYLSNISPEDCRHLLRLSPGPKVRLALEWRIKQKSSEAIH